MRNISFILALFAVAMCFAGCGHNPDSTVLYGPTDSINAGEYVVVSPPAPMTVNLGEFAIFLIAITGIVVVITLTVLYITGYIGKSKSEPVVLLTQNDYAKKAYTLGNHTWIPIDQTGKYWDDFTADNAKLILGILFVFEQAHPELEVIGWNQVIRHESHDQNLCIFGIWIDHKAKPEFEEEIKA